MKNSTNENEKQLPREFSKNGFTFRQVRREGDVALIAKRKPAGGGRGKARVDISEAGSQIRQPDPDSGGDSL